LRSNSLANPLGLFYSNNNPKLLRIKRQGPLRGDLSLDLWLHEVPVLGKGKGVTAITHSALAPSAGGGGNGQGDITPFNFNF